MSGDTRTEQFRDLWLPPVDRPEDLPAAAEEGQVCFVKSEGAVYTWRDGAWVVAAARGARP